MEKSIKWWVSEVRKMTGIAWVLGSTSLGSHWLFLFQSGKKLSHRLCLLSPASPAKKKSRSTQKSFAKSRSSPLTLTLTSFLSRLSGGFLICPTLQCPWQPLKFGQQPANDGVKKSTESKKKKAAIWQTVPTADEEDTFVTFRISIDNNKICTKSRACFVTVWCKKM